MAKEDTLKKVEHDIANGELGRARQRLHSLVSAYPNDLALRRRLGDVYHRLQYPERAGCYWYLEEPESPEMSAAQKAFERACGNHSVVILNCLKFQGDVDALDNSYARQRLKRLGSEAWQKGRRTYVPPSVDAGGWEGSLALGFLGVGLALMFIGLFTVIWRIYQALAG